jgi:cytidylate kinase
MDNILIKYLSERVQKEQDQTQYEPGPVITISRQYGCYASEIARLLSDRLNVIAQERKCNYRWQWIAKEVLDKAAKELETTPDKIVHIFAANERSFLEDMALAFSVKQYARDPKIKKLISKIVKEYAEQGHVIIVGRAGCVLTKHIKKALHVRLIASDEFRINRIKTRFELNERAAVERIKEYTNARKTFMKFFNGDKPEAEMFDLVLNRSKLSTEEIVETIAGVAQIRGLV